MWARHTWRDPTPVPVSYTHLDVYKRQGAVLSNLIAGLMLCSALMLFLGWVDPRIGTVLAGPVSVLSVTTAGLAPRMVRGTFSVAWPAPLHGGTTWRPWFGRLTVTALSLIHI